MDKFIKEKHSSVSQTNRHYHCHREYLNCDSLEAVRLYWKSTIYVTTLFLHYSLDICYQLLSVTEIVRYSAANTTYVKITNCPKSTAFTKNEIQLKESTLKP